MPFRTSHSAFRNPHSAFTLVELLVAIAIIGILSGLLLGVASRATQQGNESRTRVILSRIDTLVMQEYDTYKNRRVRVNQNAVNGIRSTLAGQDQLKAPAYARLYALRELMLMEMPDRWSDVVLAPIDQVSTDGSGMGTPVYLESQSTGRYGGPTPLIDLYRRKFVQMLKAGVTTDTIANNQSAECLYLFVMNACGDGEARSLFNESSVGDTDGDGAQEFLDGWGNPISFIRWPVGFNSDRQLSALQFSNRGDPAWLEAAAADHDPFDLFRMEPFAFRMVPLIYSAGADGRYELYTARNTTIWPLNPRLQPLSGYTRITSTEGDFYLGTPMNEAGTDTDVDGGADNITNHSLSGG